MTRASLKGVSDTIDLACGEAMLRRIDQTPLSLPPIMSWKCKTVTECGERSVRSTTLPKAKQAKKTTGSIRIVGLKNKANDVHLTNRVTRPAR